MSNATILVVEDENIVAKDIQISLRKLGYAVPAIATSGRAAIDKAAEISPDLVLMDIHLKGDMDGVEAGKELHTRFNVPVIYLTAYSDENTLERAKLTEAVGYLLKPFKARELHTMIQMALSKHRMERKLKEHEQWLATVLKSIGDAVIATDIKGVVTFMNPVAEAMTGWTQENALGRDSTEVFSTINDQTRTVIKTCVTEVLQQGKTNCIIPEQMLLITRNGKEYRLLSALHPFKATQETSLVWFWPSRTLLSASGRKQKFTGRWQKRKNLTNSNLTLSPQHPTSSARRCPQSYHLPNCLNITVTSGWSQKKLNISIAFKPPPKV